MSENEEYRSLFLDRDELFTSIVLLQATVPPLSIGNTNVIGDNLLPKDLSKDLSKDEGNKK